MDIVYLSLLCYKQSQVRNKPGITDLHPQLKTRLKKYTNLIIERLAWNFINLVTFPHLDSRSIINSNVFFAVFMYFHLYHQLKHVL
jgi:hypothetical protein